MKRSLHEVMKAVSPRFGFVTRSFNPGSRSEIAGVDFVFAAVSAEIADRERAATQGPSVSQQIFQSPSTEREGRRLGPPLLLRYNDMGPVARGQRAAPIERPRGAAGIPRGSRFLRGSASRILFGASSRGGAYPLPGGIATVPVGLTRRPRSVVCSRQCSGADPGRGAVMTNPSWRKQPS